ncbi:MAG: hypothetical protein M9921_08900 [Fimbriimonadaceae bacterium]|nr:hypothetical protein [Chthonomonadaceae bacterium]MCO5296962.1 hypothetical protein [Fimbriimonadaceae bacterium]
MHLLLIYLALGLHGGAPTAKGPATGAAVSAAPSTPAAPGTNAAPAAFDVAIADVALLQVKSVQEELKIDEATRARMNKHADAHKKALDAYRAKVEKEKIDPAKAMQSPEMAKIFKDLKDGVFSELSAAQIHRLRELTLQRAGIVAIGQADVAKQVGLNDKQLEKFRSTFQSEFQKVQKLREETMRGALKEYEGKQPKSQAEADAWRQDAQKKLAAAEKAMAPKVEALAKETESRLNALLTAEQKKAWNDLKGAPFTFK